MSSSKIYFKFNVSTSPYLFSKITSIPYLIFGNVQMTSLNLFESSEILFSGGQLFNTVSISFKILNLSPHSRK